MIRRRSTGGTEDIEEVEEEERFGDMNLFGGLIVEEEEEEEALLSGGDSFRTLAVDGFVMRKTRYAAWKERYLRSEGPFLYYYSSKLKEIKAARFAEAKTYRFDASGKSPSEVYDLRAPGLTVKVTSKTVFVLTLSSSKKLEIKTESESELKRWTTALRKIRALDQAQVKRLGTLSVEVDGGYVIGGATSCKCKVKVGSEEEVESDSALAEGRDVAYQNLDGKLDFATSVDDLKFTCKAPVYQASTICRIVLEDQDDATLASRSLPLFELQEERAQATLSMFFGGYSSNRNRESYYSTTTWPALAPDGRPPRPGFKWLALFEDDDPPLPSPGGDASELSSSSSSPYKVRAVLQVRIRYSENVLNTIDLVNTHERYEADDDHDLKEFKLDLLSSGVRRLDAFHEEVVAACAVLQSCLDWDRPLVSFFVWFLLVSCILASPDSATLAIFPLFLMVGIVATLPFALSKGRWQVEGETTYMRAKEETVRREIAEISLAVVAAKDLVAGDIKKKSTNFYLSTSDPYAIVINEPSPDDAHRLSQMLVGITSVKSNTLNPRWSTPRNQGDEDDGEKGDDAMWSNAKKSSNLFSRRNLSLDVDEDGEHLMLLRDEDSSSLIKSEDALKLVFGSGIGDHVLNEVLEKKAGRNAVSVSSSAMKDFGDGAVVKPPVDFASRWKMSSGSVSPSMASWTWPLMQEVDAKNHAPVPWRDAKGHIVIEMYDHDVSSSDDFLGRCRIPIADLFRKRRSDNSSSGVLDEWFALEPADESFAKKNASIQGAETLGSVRIAARVRVVESARTSGTAAAAAAAEASSSFGGEKNKKRSATVLHSWQHDQAIRRSVLEPEMEIEREKKSGYVKQYKDVTRSLKSMQDTVLSLATTLERILALCTWVHPAKTLLVVFGLAVGVVALLAVPSRLVVAALLTKLFLTGLVRKFRGRDKSEVVLKDKTQVQVANFIKSFPDANQRSRAYRVKRSVWASQFRRREAQVQVNLRFSFRIRCQIQACVVSRSSSNLASTLLLSRGTLRKQTSLKLFPNSSSRSGGGGETNDANGRSSPVDPDLKRWTYVYVVVVDCMVLVWPNVWAAAENKKPLMSCYIAGEPLVGRSKVEPPPHNWPLPPTYLRLVSFASKLPRSNKIKDFYLAIDPTLVRTFVDAVRSEILHAHADDTTYKPKQHRGRRLIFSAS